MNSIKKKQIVKNLIPVLGVIVREFFTGGKTKLGVYILGVTVLSLKFWAGIEPEIATANPDVLPTVAKVATAVGSTILSVGIGHDLIKKGSSIVKGVKKLIRFF